MPPAAELPVTVQSASAAVARREQAAALTGTAAAGAGAPAAALHRVVGEGAIGGRGDPGGDVDASALASRPHAVAAAVAADSRVVIDEDVIQLEVAAGVDPAALRGLSAGDLEVLEHDRHVGVHLEDPARAPASMMLASGPDDPVPMMCTAVVVVLISSWPSDRA